MRPLKNVLFILPGIEPERFYSKKAVCAFLNELKAAGVNQQLFSDVINLPLFPREASIMITTDPALLHLYPDYCILGLAADCFVSDPVEKADTPPLLTDEFPVPDFPGAAAVLLSLADLSPLYLDMQLCHFLNIPFTPVITEHLLLRESTAEDYHYLRPLFDELAVCPFPPIKEAVTADAKENQLYEQYLSYIRTAYRFFDFGFWSVIERTSGLLVGWCGLYNDSKAGLMLGYVIHPSYRRHGYASEACKGILAYARDELAVTDISVQIAKDNLPSLGLAAKLGLNIIL